MSDKKSVTFTARQKLTALCLIPLAAILLLNAHYFVNYSIAAFAYPFDLNYGEGIVWQQMRDIVAGHGYGPLGVYPAIVYHYPPVYHLVTASTAAIFGIDQLMAGRVVSWTSTLAMASLAGIACADLVGRHEPRAIRFACGAIASLIMLCMIPVIMWGSIMRVDMLCGALTLMGLVLVIRSIDHPFAAIAAGVTFTLAIYTKQTSIAAPTACFLVLVFLAPRQALSLLGTCLIIGLIALAYLIWRTDGGFLEHTLRYNVNRLDLSRGSGVLKQFQYHLFFICAAICGIGTAWKRIANGGHAIASMSDWKSKLRSDRSHFAASIILVYLLLCTVMLPMTLKSGSDINYLIEWLCAVSILVGFGAKPIMAFIIGQQRKVPWALCVLYSIAIPSAIWNISRVYGDEYREQAKHNPGDLDKLVRLIHASPKPVIADDMVLLIRAGKPVRWESAITAELGHAGIYEERKFAAMVRRGEFGFFLTRASRGKRPFDERYNPVVAEAMDEAYPRKIPFSGNVIHLPPPISLPPVPTPQQAQP